MRTGFGAHSHQSRFGLEVISPEGLDELNYYKYSGTDR